LSDASPESYPVPWQAAAAELRERGSRFLARLHPAGDEKEARRILEATAAEHPGASHHCWAWRLGWPPRERSHDAGEPSGTAGPPILRALQGAGLSDVLLLVIRWFGGTKLGRGGLVRAYGDAARAAVGEAHVGHRLQRRRLRLRLPYAETGALERLLDPPELEVVASHYGAEVDLVLAVVLSRLPALEELVARRGLSLSSVEPSLEDEDGPE